MSPTPQLQLRATDADREGVAQTLRGAAEVGALTVDELEQRLGAAYAAVTRADLARLVTDLPPLTAPHAPPVFATALAVPSARSSSLFWVWALIPLLGGAAWVHAAFLTRVMRFWLLAAVYAIPLALAFVTAPGTDDELPGWVSAVVAAFWIVNAIHAWVARSDVDAARARVGLGGRAAAR